VGVRRPCLKKRTPTIHVIAVSNKPTDSNLSTGMRRYTWGSPNTFPTFRKQRLECTWWADRLEALPGQRLSSRLVCSVGVYIRRYVVVPTETNYGF